MFNLSIIHCKGKNRQLFHVINIWKINTANLDFDGNSQCVVIESDNLENRDTTILIALCRLGSISIPILM